MLNFGFFKWHGHSKSQYRLKMNEYCKVNKSVQITDKNMNNLMFI